MAGPLAALRAVLRQRRHHPAFRIPPPAWDQTHQATLERIVALVRTAVPPVAALVALLDAELVMAKAHALAHRGDVDAAAVLLRRLERRGTAGPYGWDLLARIHAQRGDLAGADTCWQRVQATDPGDEAAAAGRRAVVAVLARSTGTPRHRRGAGCDAPARRR